MALSWGDDLAVITASSKSLCAWDRAVETEGGFPTLAPHYSSQREIFLLYLEPKILFFFRINKQHWSDDEEFSLRVVLRSNRSQPRDHSKPGLSTTHNSAVSPLAFLCPLHPLSQVCESSSLTPNSLPTLFWLLLFFSTSAKPFLSSYLEEIFSFSIGCSEASPPAFTALCQSPSTGSPQTLNPQMGHVWNCYYGSTT